MPVEDRQGVPARLWDNRPLRQRLNSIAVNGSIMPCRFASVTGTRPELGGGAASRSLTLPSSRSHCHIRGFGIGDDLGGGFCRDGVTICQMPRVLKEPSPSTNAFMTPPARPCAEIEYSLSPRTKIAVISPTRCARTRPYSSHRGCLQHMRDRRAAPPGALVQSSSRVWWFESAPMEYRLRPSFERYISKKWLSSTILRLIDDVGHLSP